MPLETIFAGGALVFGVILGSFLNALTFRYNTGESLWCAMGGRSRCMRCSTELGVLDLVPVVSWVYLSGRCRYCRGRISIQYPLVEIAAAFLSLGVYLKLFRDGACIIAETGCPEFFAMYIFWLLVWMTILFLIVYDMRHMILPFGGLILLGVLGFLSLWFSHALGGLVTPSFWQVLAGPLLAAPFVFLSAVSGGRWMGWGDGILALPLGWMLGITGGITALMLSFWIGAAVGIGLLAVQYLREPRGDSLKTGLKESPRGSRHLTLKSELPFGPFLAVGAAIVFFTDFNLFIVLGW